ncbi:MAG TPA: GNAT family N-acetyltransferase, partial [Nitrospira sp.]|nr:GNAT family N-acetyltransferase [Nitrospira sp.]
MSEPVVETIEIVTDRLRLRQWRSADRDPFAALNADPRVMEFFPATLTQAESDAMADRCERLISERGWGFWVVETRTGQEFIGMVGLHPTASELPFSPAIEISWRLAVQHWGRGYATEAAQGALRVGFTQLHMTEIVAFTAVGKTPPRTVMGRIGMHHA